MAQIAAVVWIQFPAQNFHTPQPWPKTPKNKNQTNSLYNSLLNPGKLAQEPPCSHSPAPFSTPTSQVRPALGPLPWLFPWPGTHPLWINPYDQLPHPLQSSAQKRLLRSPTPTTAFQIVTHSPPLPPRVPSRGPLSTHSACHLLTLNYICYVLSAPAAKRQAP